MTINQSINFNLNSHKLTQTGQRSIFIWRVKKRYLGRCNLGDPQESTLFRGASSTTKQVNSVEINTGHIVRFNCQSKDYGAFHYAKDSGNFGRNSNGKPFTVSSDRNIRDHLWRWSTYFGWNIPTEIRRSIFDKPVLRPN